MTACLSLPYGVRGLVQSFLEPVGCSDRASAIPLARYAATCTTHLDECELKLEQSRSEWEAHVRHSLDEVVDDVWRKSARAHYLTGDPMEWEDYNDEELDAYDKLVLSVEQLYLYLQHEATREIAVNEYDYVFLRAMNGFDGYPKNRMPAWLEEFREYGYDSRVSFF
jgi:hypothetical protein